MRKFLVVLSTVCIVCFVVYGLYLLLNKPSQRQSTLDSMGVVPQDAFQTVLLLSEDASSNYDELFSRYNQQKAKYDEGVQIYAKLTSEYEKQATYWNGQGGAPRKEHDALEKFRKELDTLNVSLEQNRRTLNENIVILNDMTKQKK
jgi:hypothetical protein